MQMSLMLKITTINPDAFPPVRMYKYSLELTEEAHPVFEPRFLCIPTHTYYEMRSSHCRRFVSFGTIDTSEHDPDVYKAALLDYLNKYHSTDTFDDKDIETVTIKIKASISEKSSSLVCSAGANLSQAY